jgi:hypothetical protein
LVGSTDSSVGSIPFGAVSGNLAGEIAWIRSVRPDACRQVQLGWIDGDELVY